MLRDLVSDVDGRAAARDPAALLPLRQIAGPWLMVIALALAFIVLARVPGVHLSDLARRFIVPLADVPPVTSTRLAVLTGNRDVVQSEPLYLEAALNHLRLGDQVLLVTRADGDEQWSHNAMEPVPGSQQGDAARFAFTIASVSRDLRYYVTAGDAKSRTYAVRVKRPPAVERFSIRYEYPAYSGRSALTVSNSCTTVR